jgi:hypothetical protein
MDMTASKRTRSSLAGKRPGGGSAAVGRGARADRRGERDGIFTLSLAVRTDGRTG